MAGKERKCSDCRKTFSTNQNYDRHVLELHSGEKPFKCPTCGKCYNRNDYLKIHVRMHTGEKPFKCTLCDKEFASSSHLKYHEFAHTGVPYKCRICPRRFRKPSQLKIHSRLHTGEKPFECCECYMKFISKATLVSHMRVHTTTEKSFSCDICPNKYRYKAGLKSHLRIHTGEPLKCSICDYQTVYSSDLRKHVKCVHVSEVSSLFQCALCVKKFKWKGALELHIRLHTGEKPYKCKFCGKCFISPNGMQACIRRHTGEKPYENDRNPHKCKICSKFFDRQAHLKTHTAAQHRGEKAFHYTHCPKKFRRKNGLAEHFVHHDGGNYKCNFCPKEFKGPYMLAQHLRSHTREKPFKCKLCPYRSRRRVGDDHMICHERVGKFNCRICTFSSQKSYPVLQHEKNDHGSDILSITNNCMLTFKSHCQSSSGLEAQRITCNECKFSCFNLKYICVHYSQCHGLPRVMIRKLCLDGE